MFFVLATKELCLSLARQRGGGVYISVCVWHVDGTPATSKLQPDVKAQGLATQGPTVGGARTVQ